MPVTRRPNPRTKTVVVSRSAKGQPDYICDGTADDVQIQAAIDQVEALGGGIIHLTAGTYSIATGLTITGSEIILEGEGWETVLAAVNSLDDYVISMINGTSTVANCVLRDFKIFANGGNQAAGGGIKTFRNLLCSYERLSINEPYDWGIYFEGDFANGFGHHNTVFKVHIDQGDNSSGVGQGIYFRYTDEVVVTSCDFQYMGGSGMGSNYGAITDNGTGLIQITDCSFVECQSGVYTYDANHVIIKGNMFDKCHGHSVRIKSSDCVVANNQIFAIGEGNAGQVAGIFMEWSAYGRNIIVGNVLRSHHTNSTTKHFVLDEQINNTYIGNQYSVHGTLSSDPFNITSTTHTRIDRYFDGTNYTGITSLKGGVVINEMGADEDFRVESDTNTHALFLDAGNSRVGINNPDPLSDLDIIGNFRFRDAATPTKGVRFRFGGATDVEGAGADVYYSVWSNGDFSGTQHTYFKLKSNGDGVQFVGKVILNDESGDIDTIIRGDTDGNLLFADASTDRIGIGTASPAVKLDVVGSGAFSGDVTVSDEAYGSGWNASLEVPTKNAVYDKIETITGSSGISESLAIAYAIVL